MIKKDIILSEQDIGSFFYSFLKREYKSDMQWPAELHTPQRPIMTSSFGGGGGVLKFELGTEVQPNVSTTTL